MPFLMNIQSIDELVEQDHFIYHHDHSLDNKYIYFEFIFKNEFFK